MYGLQGRRSKYARKGTMARSSKYLRRLLDSANNRVASSDRRQLTGVVRRHRLANPYQITPSAGRTVSFWRKVEINISLNQLTGFNGSNSLNWGFGLKGCYGYRGGVLLYIPAVPGFSEWQALFDYYKINAVKMTLFFTKTIDAVSATTGASHGMPVLLIANDFDDLAENMTLDSMNQRIGCRHVQFASDQYNGINHYIKPQPSTVVVQTADDGTQVTSNAGVPMGTTWLDCASSNIVHQGVKVYYDNQGLTSNVVLGNVTFIFDIEFCFKGYR